MSETTERLDQIETRIRDCQTYNFGMRNADKLAHEDAPYLLTLARKQAAALERVEALADSFDGLGSDASYHGTEAEMETWLSAANHLRAQQARSQQADRIGADHIRHDRDEEDA
jgi:hypothetical protein